MNDKKCPVMWDLSPRNKKPIEHYETKSLKRGDFERICISKGEKFCEFEEIDSGEKSGTNRKFFYKRRENES